LRHTHLHCHDYSTSAYCESGPLNQSQSQAPHPFLLIRDAAGSRHPAALSFEVTHGLPADAHGYETNAVPAYWLAFAVALYMTTFAATNGTLDAWPASFEARTPSHRASRRS